MSESKLRIDIIEKFCLLQNALVKLSHTIATADRSLPAWFVSPTLIKTNYDHLTSANNHTENNTNTNFNLVSNSPNSYHNQVIEFLNQLEFLDTQDPKEILLGPGIFACSKITFDAIHHLNKTKDEFKQAILNLRASNLKITDPFLTERFESTLNTANTISDLKARPQKLTTSLAKMGLARLHLKQCYRKIPTLNHRPKSVSWTWANTRAIKKIDLVTAEQMLLKNKRDPKIDIQLQKLKRLKDGEPLAIVQELAPHLRANIVIAGVPEDVRFMIKGSMPIFYVDTEGASLPKFTPPIEKKSKDKNRQTRSDVKLDPDPFLPAIRAHRYLEEKV